MFILNIYLFATKYIDTRLTMANQCERMKLTVDSPRYLYDLPLKINKSVWIGCLYRQTTKMEQMVGRLVAAIEKMEAKLDVDHERMMAKMDCHHV